MSRSSAALGWGMLLGFAACRFDPPDANDYVASGSAGQFAATGLPGPAASTGNELMTNGEPEPSSTGGDDPDDSSTGEQFPSASSEGAESTKASSTGSGGSDEGDAEGSSSEESGAGTTDLCSNGVLDADEDCDGAELAALTCEDIGFAGGVLACTSACAFDTTACEDLPGVLRLTFSPIKQFNFSWTAMPGAEYYQLEESAAPGEPFVKLGEDIVGTSISITMPLHFRYRASYRLQSCSIQGCTESAAVDVVGTLAEAVGHIEASSPGKGDSFGASVALSGDGNTLAVGAPYADAPFVSVGDDQTDVYYSVGPSGVIYVFVRDEQGRWSEQANISASNAGRYGDFGGSVTLSRDGNTLAVGAANESSNATGIGDDPVNDSAPASGAVYVFVREQREWSQQAYVKASNADGGDRFGESVALSGDGNTLAVGAPNESSISRGIDGDQDDDQYGFCGICGEDGCCSYCGASGATYVFVRDVQGDWSQQAYVKASNADGGDEFGSSVALSEGGDTLAVGAPYEDSTATGVGGDQGNDPYYVCGEYGAVYVFVRDHQGEWSQQAYVKASNTDRFDNFGLRVAISGDGNTLAVGAPYEGYDVVDIGIEYADEDVFYYEPSGAVYIFGRDVQGAWSEEAYVKASNRGGGDAFGSSVALSGDGDTLAVGAPYEDGIAAGIDGDQVNGSVDASGATYVFVHETRDGWSQQAYVKASTTYNWGDLFGSTVALSGEGETLVVGAPDKASYTAGEAAGAVYLF